MGRASSLSVTPARRMLSMASDDAASAVWMRAATRSELEATWSSRRTRCPGEKDSGTAPKAGLRGGVGRDGVPWMSPCLVKCGWGERGMG